MSAEELCEAARAAMHDYLCPTSPIGYSLVAGYKKPLRLAAVAGVFDLLEFFQLLHNDRGSQLKSAIKGLRQRVVALFVEAEHPVSTSGSRGV